MSVIVFETNGYVSLIISNQCTENFFWISTRYTWFIPKTKIWWPTLDSWISHHVILLLSNILTIFPSLMCICMYACMHVCMYACMHGCMDAWMHGCMDACMHGCMDAWMHGCMDAWMHGCMDVWMYACMHACMHAYMYVYIYTYTYVHMCVYIYTVYRCVCVSFKIRVFPSRCSQVVGFHAFPLPCTQHLAIHSRLPQ